MPVDIEKLEAVIESACKEAVRRGFDVYYSAGPGEEHCPLAAVARVNDGDHWTTAAFHIGAHYDGCVDFANGFDGLAPEFSWQEYYELGKKFRQRVDAGEFSRAVVCPETP